MTWHPSRREALGAAVALSAGAVAGCSSGTVNPSEKSSPSSPSASTTDTGGNTVDEVDILPRDPLDRLEPLAPLQLSADGQTVAALGFGEVIFFTTATGKVASRTVFDNDVSDFASNVPWAWSGPVIALSDWRDDTTTINLLDSSTGNPISRVVVGDPAVDPWEIALSPDGSLLASVLQDGTIRVHSTANGEELHRVQPENADVSESGDPLPAVAYTMDGLLVLSSGFEQCPVQFWSGDGSRLLRLMPEQAEPYHQFQLTPDAAHCSMLRRVGKSWDTSAAESRDANTFELIESHPMPGNPKSAALHPSGTHLAWVGDWDKGSNTSPIHVLAFATGEVIRLDGDQRRPRSLVYTPDGTTLLSMDPRAGIHAWDHGSATLRQVFELPG